MSEFVLPVGLVIATILLGAWREYRDDNPRDAKLLAGFGLGGTLAGVAALLV
jgi:hypothetical protein